MIAIRRARDRHKDRRRHHEVWLTFHAKDRADPLADGFGILWTLDENRLPPGASVAAHPRRASEVVTYVREGVLAQEDSSGRSGIICAGEFQHTSTLRGARQSERNASQAVWAHVFRIALQPSGVKSKVPFEQKRFSIADRHGVFCLIASPDGRLGSLCIPLEAMIYSTLLDVGQHLIHELLKGRGAWLHVVHGEITLGDQVLAAGDGAAVTALPMVSFTAREESEVLLIDLVHK